jgi:oligosaccharide reducing-end xylanase
LRKAEEDVVIMKQRHIFFAFILCLQLLLGHDVMRSCALQESNHVGAFYSGTYINLFTTLVNIDSSLVQAKVDSAFCQLFYGDDKTQRLYFPVGNDMAYIEDVLHQDVRTEGMSYGMMIAVQMNKKNEFDHLWKWAKTFMWHRSGPSKGYFAWQCKTDGTVIDHNTAADGEEWFAMALFFASARWGDGEGIYNYSAEAQQLLNVMLHKETDAENDGSMTNLFNLKEHQVVFVPNLEASVFTDPSYHLPHYYELWARRAETDTQFWYDAATASRQYLKKAANLVTGLAPDYSRFDGTPITTRWANGANNFQYDAWRVAANVAVDYLWFAKDVWEINQSNRLLNFFYSEGIKQYGVLYTLDGKKLSNDHSAGLVAMNAVAALASTNANRKEFVEELWNLTVPAGEYRYYDGMLYMLAMLEVSGNFRIYTPAVHH